MAFSLESDTYLAFYGGLTGQPRAGENTQWALDSDNLQRLQRARQEYDPDRRFQSFGHLF